MNTLTSGVQLISIPENNYHDYGIPAFFIALLVALLVVLIVSSMRVFVGEKTEDKSSNQRKAESIAIYTCIVLILLATTTPLILLKKFDDQHAGDYRTNIGRLNDSYGLAVKKDNGIFADNHVYDGVSRATTGTYTMKKEDYAHGTTIYYKIMVDDQKVLRVFRFNRQDAKTWVEVQPKR